MASLGRLTLAPGSLIAVRYQSDSTLLRGWRELQILSPLPVSARAGSLFIVVEPGGTIGPIDLDALTIDEVACGERPSVHLRSIGEKIEDCFDDSSFGGPLFGELLSVYLHSGNQVADMVMSVLPALAAADGWEPPGNDGWLRGGAVRISAKTTQADADQRGREADEKAKTDEKVKADQRTREQAALVAVSADAPTGADGGAGLPGTSGLQKLSHEIGGGGLAVKPAWFRDDAVAAELIGQEWVPTSNLVTLGERGLDIDVNGNVTVITRLHPDHVVEMRRRREASMRSALGGATPRGAPDDGDGLGGLFGAVPVPRVGGVNTASRTLALAFNGVGARYREIRATHDALQEEEIVDWPLKGPRSLKWVLRFMLDQTGGGPCARVQQFMQLAKLQYTDGHMTEYNILAKVLELAIQWDQLMVSNLACFELISRRMQLIEEKYKMRLPQMDKNVLDPESDAGIFLGLGTHSMAGRNTVCVMPALAEYIGEELNREASISKGKVKAHQLRLELKKLSHGPGKGHKDDEK